ncbi:MAG: IS6 family transposase [Nitrososphaerales archaeon]
MNPQEQSGRMERGLAIAKRNEIVENADGSFSVPSQTVGEIAYRVVPFNGWYSCNCPDFVERHAEIQACKHIHAVKFWIAARVELQNRPKPKVFSEDALQCGRCGSIRVIRYGVRGGKQAYWCKDCARKFTPSLLKKAKYTPEMITLTLDLYFGGLSLRKVARTVNDHFGTEMGSTSIYRWIQTFVPKIANYANSLTPELSGTWHADELFVKMKGGINYKAHYGGEAKNIAFLWNVMDRKTRFLLASKLSTFRDVAGADRAFREAIRNAGGSQPERVVTDGLNSYKTVMASLAESQRPQHIANAGVSKRHATNNRIERLNGTLRERVKVQRGWKNPTSKIAEGQRIHYNFVKPHQALEGQTPAERAGVGVDGQNRWMELLKKAVRQGQS